MRPLGLAVSLGLVAALATSADAANAQTRVVIDNASPSYSTYARRPVRRAAPRPRVIVVERIVVDRDRNKRRDYRWWRTSGYRPVTVYFVGGRYYDRWVDRRGIREVIVYRRGNRYYRDWDDDGRYDRRYDDRYDDRYDRYDRNDDRYRDDRSDYDREHDRWIKEHADDRDYDRRHSEWHRDHDRDRYDD